MITTTNLSAKAGQPHTSTVAGYGIGGSPINTSASASSPTVGHTGRTPASSSPGST